MKCIIEFPFLTASASKTKAVISNLPVRQTGKFILKIKRVISEPACGEGRAILAGKKPKRTLLLLAATQTISKSKRTHRRKRFPCAAGSTQASASSGESLKFNKTLLAINANIAQMS